jgi:hypothetical protein
MLRAKGGRCAVLHKRAFRSTPSSRLHESSLRPDEQHFEAVLREAVQDRRWKTSGDRGIYSPAASEHRATPRDPPRILRGELQKPAGCSRP